MVGTQNDVVLYEEDGSIAFVTLNRPERLNAINQAMLAGLEAAVDRANASSAVRSIVLRGAGRAFCAGYDLSGTGRQRSNDSPAAPAWTPEPGSPSRAEFEEFNHDQVRRFMNMSENVRRFMKLWHSPKPVIAQLHGYAMGGGTDMILCADVIFMAEDAVTGYAPGRILGTPTTMMWVYRLGLEHAKYFMLNGGQIDAPTALRIGLVSEVHPLEELPQRVEEYARKLEHIPWDQLALNKWLVNQAYENMGLRTTQMLGTFFDGLTTNTYEHYLWNSLYRTVGFREAVRRRDQPFGDYGERPAAVEAREARRRAPGYSPNPPGRQRGGGL